MIKNKFKYIKCPVAVLLAISLCLQFMPAIKPVKASLFSDAVNWFQKKMPRIPDVVLTEQGDFKIGSLVLFDCLCRKYTVVLPDGAVEEKTRCLAGECKAGTESCSKAEECCSGFCTDKGKCLPATTANNASSCVNPFSLLKVKWDGKTITSQVPLVAENGAPAIPRPTLLPQCELRIPPAQEDEPYTEEQKIAKNRACISLGRLQKAAAQEVYLAKRIFNNTDPFSECFFLRNCRSSCSLRLGEFTYTIGILDIAALFLPGGAMVVVQKILNIAKIIGEVYKIWKLIKDLFKEGINFINDFMEITQGIYSLLLSFSEAGLKASDALIYGAGAFSSYYFGGKLKEIGADKEGKVGWLIGKSGSALTAGDGLLGGVAATAVLNNDTFNGFKQLLGSLAGNLLKFSTAKSEALSFGQQIKTDIGEVRNQLKKEPEFGWLFSEGCAQSTIANNNQTATDCQRRQMLNQATDELLPLFESIDSFLLEITKATTLKDGTPVVAHYPGEGLVEWRTAPIWGTAPEEISKFHCAGAKGVKLEVDFPAYLNWPACAGERDCYLPQRVIARDTCSVPPAQSTDCDWLGKAQDIYRNAEAMHNLLTPQAVAKVVEEALAGLDPITGGYVMKVLDGTKKAWVYYWADLYGLFFGQDKAKVKRDAWDQARKDGRPALQKEIHNATRNSVVDLVNRLFPASNYKSHMYEISEIETVGINGRNMQTKNSDDWVQYRINQAQIKLDGSWNIIGGKKSEWAYLGEALSNSFNRTDRVNAFSNGINDAVQLSTYQKWLAQSKDAKNWGNKFWYQDVFCGTQTDTDMEKDYFNVSSNKVTYDADIAYENWDDKISIVQKASSNFPVLNEALSWGLSPKEPLLVYQTSKTSNTLDEVIRLAEQLPDCQSAFLQENQSLFSKPKIVLAQADDCLGTCLANCDTEHAPTNLESECQEQLTSCCVSHNGCPAGDVCHQQFDACMYHTAGALAACKSNCQLSCSGGGAGGETGKEPTCAGSVADCKAICTDSKGACDPYESNCEDACDAGKNSGTACKQFDEDYFGWAQDPKKFEDVCNDESDCGRACNKGGQQCVRDCKAFCDACQPAVCVKNIIIDNSKIIQEQLKKLADALRKLQNAWNEPITETQESLVVRRYLLKLVSAIAVGTTIVNDIIPPIKTAVVNLRNALPHLKQNSELAKQLTSALDLVDKILEQIKQRLGEQYACPSDPTKAEGFLPKAKCFQDNNKRTFLELVNFADLLSMMELSDIALSQANEALVTIQPDFRLKPLNLSVDLADQVEGKYEACAKCRLNSQDKASCLACDTKPQIFSEPRVGQSTFDNFKAALFSNPISSIEDGFKTTENAINLAMAAWNYPDDNRGALQIIARAAVFGRAGDNRQAKYQKALEALQKKSRMLWWELIWGPEDDAASINLACDRVSLVLNGEPQDIEKACNKRTDDDKTLLIDNEVNRQLKQTCADISQMDIEFLLNPDQLQNEIVRLGQEKIIDRRACITKENCDDGSKPCVACPANMVQAVQNGQWPPVSKCQVAGQYNPNLLIQKQQGAKTLCLETEQEMADLTQQALVLNNTQEFIAQITGGLASLPKTIPDLLLLCDQLAYQQDMERECNQFFDLRYVFVNKCNQASDKTTCQNNRNYLKQFCVQSIAKDEFKCAGGMPQVDFTFNSTSPGGDDQDKLLAARAARLEASQVCSDAITDLRTPLKEIMKVFAVLLGVQSYSQAKASIGSLQTDARAIREKGEQVIASIKGFPEKFKQLWGAEDDKVGWKDQTLTPLMCIENPMVSYTKTGQKQTGPNGGQVCPDIDLFFGQLEAQFTDARTNLRLIDLARRDPSKTFNWGDLGFKLTNYYEINEQLDEVVCPIYRYAEEIKNNAQFLWAMAVAVDFANKQCTCGQSYCPMIWKIPFCISGLPITTAPLTQPYCSLVWLLRNPLGSLAAKVEQDLELTQEQMQTKIDQYARECRDERN